VGAKVRQISAVPRWVFVLRTKTQLKPVVVTLLTTTFVPLDEPSDAMKASTSSFGDVVENAELTIVALAACPLVTFASMPMAAQDVPAKPMKTNILENRMCHFLAIPIATSPHQAEHSRATALQESDISHKRNQGNKKAKSLRDCKY
jgi:hypothetical protein